MKTSDIISLLSSVPSITAIVGAKILNAKVPTKDAVTGEVDMPFLWIQHRNNLPWGNQNPQPGEEPMGKVYDVEAVAATADELDTLRDAVYSVHGFSGAAGTASVDKLFVADQSDDYVQRNMADDAGAFVGSFLFQVIGA